MLSMLCLFIIRLEIGKRFLEAQNVNVVIRWRKYMRKVNINTDWMFTKSVCEFSELKDKSFEEVNIPHTWNGVDGQSGGNNYHRGLCWYKKSLAFDEHEGDIFIEFGAVNSIAHVYLNDTYLGKHEGGYSAFRFNITDAVVDGENTLTVGADNRHNEDIYPLFADFTFYGGIYRDVNVIYKNRLHFSQMDFASSGVFVSQDKITDEEAELSVRALVVNGNSHSSMKITVLDKENSEVYSETVNEVADETIHKFKLTNPILWNGMENPYLYTVKVELTNEGLLSDQVEISTGLRYFAFDADKGFFLNGKALRLNGVSRHQDRETVGNALTEDHQIQDMELIKEIGANSIRLAHYQHDKFFYDLCDKEGMIVWAEIPYISRTSETDETASNAISQMHELVRQKYNHPSIIMWGVQNEIGMMAEKKPLAQISREVNEVAKADDTTRVTTQAQVMLTPHDDPSHDETDVVAYNKYYGWYVGETQDFDGFVNEFKELNPTKGLGISEYGAEGILKYHTDTPAVKDYTEEYHALYHEDCMRIFNSYDFIWGTYVWNMFDFGSDFRDEGGVQGRNNKGLITFDRSIKKDAFYFYQSIWSEKPMLHITSKRFEKRHLEEIEVKVYSNNGNVSLTANGEDVSLSSRDNTIFKFKVKLNKDFNQIVAKSGDLTDEVIFEKVDEIYEQYLLPESEKDKGMLSGDSNVVNWFEMDLDENIGELEYPEGYMSINNIVLDILKTSEGEAILDKYMTGFTDNPMFEVASKLSLKMIFDFQKDAFPEIAVYNINKELNNIKIAD